MIVKKSACGFIYRLNKSLSVKFICCELLKKQDVSHPECPQRVLVGTANVLHFACIFSPALYTPAQSDLSRLEQVEQRECSCSFPGFLPHLWRQSSHARSMKRFCCCCRTSLKTHFDTKVIEGTYNFI